MRQQSLGRPREVDEGMAGEDGADSELDLFN
jgi:hypothetical protein